MTTTTDLIPLFVYGTLRRGHGLHDHIRYAALPNDPVHFPALIEGELRYHDCMYYPVLTPGDRAVVGDFYMLPDCRALMDVLTMEHRAGYTVTTREVLIQLHNGETVFRNALVCLWERPAHFLPLVPGQDWDLASPPDGWVN